MAGTELFTEDLCRSENVHPQKAVPSIVKITSYWTGQRLGIVVRDQTVRGPITACSFLPSYTHALSVREAYFHSQVHQATIDRLR